MNKQTLRALPKAELHRHLDGSVRPGTILDLTRRHRIDLGSSSEQEVIRKARITAPMKDLQSVLDCFTTTQKVLCGYEAIRRVTFENVEDAYRDGVRLIELRFAPPFIAAGKELDNDEIIEAVLDGATRGMETYPIQVGLIGILPRSFDSEVNRRATEDLIRYATGAHRNSHRLCGFDLAGAEDSSDPRTFAPFVDKARAAGLGITVHSGENTDAAALCATLDLFRPGRIGHGIRSWGDEKTLERLRNENVLLEICPTSNWLTSSVPSLEEHPLLDLYRAGVAVSINSDDPNIFAIDLVHEYEICARLFGFSTRDFLKINRQSVERSFLPEEIRAEVLKKHFPAPP